MASSLIIFTPRSGSTIAAELLAYKHKAINLDEMITGQIRGVLLNKLSQDIKRLIYDSRVLNQDVNYLFKDGEENIVDVYNIYKKRFNLAKQIHNKHSIVFKYFPYFSLPAVKILDWAKDNNFEIYFLTRKSGEDQLYSYLLAHAKERFYKNARQAGKLDMPNYAGFLNVKSSPRVEFPPISFGEESALTLISVLCGINNTWTAYYNKFKDYGKLVYYEDSIGKGNFTDFGITPNMYSKYSAQPNSIRPTHEYTVGSQISNWNEMLEIFSHYNTLE